MHGWIHPHRACGLAQILYIFILNMEPINLQSVTAVEIEDAIGTSQRKTKIG